MAPPTLSVSLEDIRAALATESTTERVYDVDLTDDIGVVHASIRKTIHIRRKEATTSPAPPALEATP